MEIKELISKEKIEKRIEELAEEISKDYEGKSIEFIVVKVKPNVRFDFIEISSYSGRESTGVLKVNKDLKADIGGKDVLIVEDIIDTGRTLSYLREYLLSKKPNSLKICTLIDKPSRRIIDVPIDYNGFDIEDKFIVGHGFDIDEDYRNIPYIGYF